VLRIIKVNSASLPLSTAWRARSRRWGGCVLTSRLRLSIAALDLPGSQAPTTLLIAVARDGTISGRGVVFLNRGMTQVCVANVLIQLGGANGTALAVRCTYDKGTFFDVGLDAAIRCVRGACRRDALW
jgi:hypothetical protein